MAYFSEDVIKSLIRDGEANVVVFEGKNCYSETIYLDGKTIVDANDCVKDGVSSTTYNMSFDFDGNNLTFQIERFSSVDSEDEYFIDFYKIASTKKELEYILNKEGQQIIVEEDEIPIIHTFQNAYKKLKEICFTNFETAPKDNEIKNTSLTIDIDLVSNELLKGSKNIIRATKEDDLYYLNGLKFGFGKGLSFYDGFMPKTYNNPLDIIRSEESRQNFKESLYLLVDRAISKDSYGNQVTNIKLDRELTIYDMIGLDKSPESCYDFLNYKGIDKEKILEIFKRKIMEDDNVHELVVKFAKKINLKDVSWADEYFLKNPKYDWVNRGIALDYISRVKGVNKELILEQVFKNTPLEDMEYGFFDKMKNIELVDIEKWLIPKIKDYSGNVEVYFTILRFAKTKKSDKIMELILSKLPKEDLKNFQSVLDKVPSIREIGLYSILSLNENKTPYSNQELADIAIRLRESGIYHDCISIKDFFSNIKNPEEELNEDTIQNLFKMFIEYDKYGKYSYNIISNTRHRSGYLIKRFSKELKRHANK